MATRETAENRKELVREAGHPTISFLSVLAGTLVAFGAVTLIAAAAGAVGSQLGLDTQGISSDEWRNAGMAGAAVGALVLFGSFFFGGYTAGRMGRRAGTTHGALVFVLSLAVIAVVTLLAALWGDAESVRDSLAAEGVPTDQATWSDIGIGAAVAGVLAMVIGAVLGGWQGDRWHGRLAEAVVEQRATRRRRLDRARTHLGSDPTTIDVRDHATDRRDATAAAQGTTVADTDTDRDMDTSTGTGTGTGTGATAYDTERRAPVDLTEGGDDAGRDDRTEVRGSADETATGDEQLSVEEARERDRQTH